MPCAGCARRRAAILAAASKLKSSTKQVLGMQTPTKAKPFLQRTLDPRKVRRAR